MSVSRLGSVLLLKLAFDQLEHQSYELTLNMTLCLLSVFNGHPNVNYYVITNAYIDMCFQSLILYVEF